MHASCSGTRFDYSRRCSRSLTRLSSHESLCAWPRSNARKTSKLGPMPLEHVPDRAFREADSLGDASVRKALTS